MTKDEIKNCKDDGGPEPKCGYCDFSFICFTLRNIARGSKTAEKEWEDFHLESHLEKLNN